MVGAGAGVVREKRAGQPRDVVNGDVWHARRHMMDAHGHGQGRHGASDTGRGSTSRAPLAMYEADPVLFTILEFFFLVRLLSGRSLPYLLILPLTCYSKTILLINH